MDKLAAQLSTTMHLVGRRMRERAEKGQGTAEYVGILAFAALLAIFLIGFHDEIGTRAKGIIDSVFGKIETEVGGGGGGIPGIPGI